VSGAGWGSLAAPSGGDGSSEPEEAQLETSPAHDVAAARSPSDLLVDRLPAPLIAFGAVVAVGGTQGGYFPNMWGPSALALLALVALWLIGSARTDAGRADVAFIGLLVLLSGWIALSITWSAAPAQSILDLERILVPVAGVTSLLLYARRRAASDIGLALALGLTVLCGYGLATRLFPASLGAQFDPINGYRLSEPVGYWNGLGILAAIGLIIASGCAIDARATWRRVMAALCLVVLAPTLEFTFSRGAWIALGIGMTALVACSPRRLAAIGSLVLLAPAPALAVLAASRSRALTHVDAQLSEAAADGRRLFVVLLGLGLLAAGSAVLLQAAAARLDPSRGIRKAIGAMIGVAVVAVSIGVFAHTGPPWTIADSAIETFKQPPATPVGTGLNQRLFQFSGTGRVDLWRVAISTAADNPLLGIGAGAFERFWQQDDDWTFKARDAHNLYLETLAELGPAGLALLLGIIGTALGVCLMSRREPLVPAAFGALIAYAVHAGVDWDWELPVVSLAALIAGSLGLIAWRSSDVRRLQAAPRLVAALGVTTAAVIAVTGFLGNDALDRAEYALDAGNASVAVKESRRAQRFSPWSPYPFTVEGEALLALGRRDAAEAAFRSAIAEDDGYWRAWLGLGVASSGRARAAAIREARRLYPRSVEIAESEKLLRDQTS
jgi:hypothetical protein